MKFFIVLFALLVSTTSSLSQAGDEQTIRGKVSHLSQPLANVKISSEKLQVSVQTDKHGKYDLSTVPGDRVTFSHPDMRETEIIVEDVTSILNIEMNPKVNELDEVVVQKTRIKSQKQLQLEYSSNKNLINTAFGILDKDITNYSVRILDASEIPLGGIDFVSAIQFRFPGIRVERPQSDPLRPVIYLRGGALGFFPAIYDVDGLILEETPTFIHVENIERIAILSGLGLVNKYGGKANGGVVVINTKGANYFPDTITNGPYDQARLRNNIYEGKALTSEDTFKDKPTYLLQLYSSKTEEEAKKLYKGQAKTYGNSYNYIVDVYGYFSTKWRAKDFADSIVEEHWRVFANNPVALKALAYAYQAQERGQRAHEIIKKIFMLRPSYAQSYLDLANSYRDIGEFKKSASIFARYDYLISQGFIQAEDQGFTALIRRDFNNLLKLHGKDLVQNQGLKENKKEDDFKGVRLVFEWNNSEADFELQFINPDDNYYVWEHSLKAAPERIKDEKLKGYSSQEYLIDDSLKGIWQVNAKYFGNKSLTPSYLKATVYHNYGSSSQYKEVRLIKLSLKDVDLELFKISNAPGSQIN